MEILGLSGYARSGKDEVAKVLVNEFGWTRVAFADKLRDVLYELNPIVGGRFTDSDYGHNDRFEYEHVKYVIDRHGWDGYKETKYGPEIRRLLQRLGTEAGRETLGENIWVDSALTGLPEDAKVVVTDVRFPNEAQAIKDRSGFMVRVNRTGNKPANAHVSETALDDWKFDYLLANDGTLEEFHDYIRKFQDYLGEEAYFRHVIGI